MPDPVRPHHKTNTTGQLKPLRERIGDYRMGKRAIHIEGRRTTMETASIALGRANVALGVLSRGFFGRVKWLLFGR